MSAKLTTFLAGICVLLLGFIWTGVSPSALTSFSIFESSVALNENSTIIIPDEIDSVLVSLYRSTDIEYVFCLYGSQEGNRIIVDNIRETTVLYRSNTELKFEKCKRNGNYLGTIHSHPKPSIKGFVQTCELSKTDVFTFAVNEDVLTGVICGVVDNDGKYGWYDRYELDHGYAYEVTE